VPGTDEMPIRADCIFLGAASAHVQHDETCSNSSRILRHPHLTFTKDDRRDKLRGFPFSRSVFLDAESSDLSRPEAGYALAG